MNLPYFSSEILSELENRCTLHWNCRGFTELPIELLYFGKDVEEIYLKWNELEKLPDWINKLEKLRNLYLYGNKIKCLPDTIEALKYLSAIDLQNNCLNEFPISVKELKNLTILNLQTNGIKNIPEEVKGLRSLMQFNLRGNKLKELPNTFYKLNSLQELILDDNELEELPLNIVYMPNLTFLSVKSNNIYTMPFQKFISNPQIIFSQNPYLNYMSCEFGSSITNPFIGYFKGKKTTGYTNLTIYSKNLILTMPKCLKHVYNNDNFETPSLLELALRQCYLSYFKIENDIRKCFIELKELPNNLSEYFNNGPVGKCHFCKCPFFLECLAWFIERLGTPPVEEAICFDVIYCVTFCSLACSTKFWFKETLRHKLNSLAWKLNIE